MSRMPPFLTRICIIRLLSSNKSVSKQNIYYKKYDGFFIPLQMLFSVRSSHLCVDIKTIFTGHQFGEPCMYCTNPWGGGGYSLEFLVGVCHLVLQILTLFQTKKCHFFTPVFRPGLKEIMSPLLRLECGQKRFL